MPDILYSFKPFVDKKSKVLILGSMPGPVALRKQQFYGFDGNYFWTIIPALFGKEKPSTYKEKLKLVKQNRIALWDVLESCVRQGALDSAIRDCKPNQIPSLIKKFPNIQAIFINGRTAHKIFMKEFGSTVNRPVYYLPSTSPAHAAMSLKEKLKKWSVIKKALGKR